MPNHIFRSRSLPQRTAGARLLAADSLSSTGELAASRFAGTQRALFLAAASTTTFTIDGQEEKRNDLLNKFTRLHEGRGEVVVGANFIKDQFSPLEIFLMHEPLSGQRDGQIADMQSVDARKR